MTVEDLLGRVSSRELSEWQAYAKLENEDADRRMLEAKAQSGLQKVKANRV